MRLTHAGWLAVAVAAACSDGSHFGSGNQAVGIGGDTYAIPLDAYVDTPDGDTSRDGPVEDASVQDAADAGDAGDGPLADADVDADVDAWWWPDAAVDAPPDDAAPGDGPLADAEPDAPPDAGCTPGDGPVSEDPYLLCMAELFHAREAYYDVLASALSGTQPPLSSGPGSSTPTELDPAVNGAKAAESLPANYDTMSAATAAAYIKMEDFDESFYEDVTLENYELFACSEMIRNLPSEPGWFGDDPPYGGGGGGGYGGGGGGIGFGGPPVCGVNDEPPEPRPNCVGEVHAAWISHVAGEKDESDSTTCADYDSEIGLTQTTRATGPTARAFGGDRKEAKRSKNGPTCEMKSPVANFDVGIHVKPFAVFRPMWVRIQEKGEKPKYVKNDKAKLMFTIPNPNGGADVKRGPTCPAGAELTMRTIAEMNVVYYVHAMVVKDADGYSGGPDSYQAMVDIDQKCYGPGTQVTNPTTFSIVPSEQDKEIRLKVLKDCEMTEQWQGNVDASVAMGNKPGVGFGFNGGASSTIKCKQQLDFDNIAFGGCVANQNFSNTSFTTKPQAGAIPIGAVYQFFNPADPTGSAPVGYMGMGMQLNGMQVRATSTPSTQHAGVAGAALATILVDRKKITDDPGQGKVVIQLGSNTCALLATGGQRPADECKIPVPNWPLVLKTAKPTKPSATDMNNQFTKLVDNLANSAK